MLFSSNDERMKRTAHVTRKARRRSGRWPAVGWKPAVEPLEERTLLSLFGPPHDYATGGGDGPGGVAVGDINGDGIPDIVAGNANNNSVSVLLGKGDGTFGTHKDFAVGSVPVRVALGDLNKDGRLDIVTANDFGESVSVLLTNGNGTVTRTDYSPGLGLTVCVAVGDVNGDGALDIVAGDYSNSKVVVLLNKGNGTFTSKVPFSVPGANTRGVALGDLNNDGKLDLAVIYHNSAVVSVLMGNGNGTFGPGTNYARAASAGAGLALGDLNGDGALDIVAPNANSNSVSVLLNHGDGTFAPKTDYVMGSAPEEPALGDMDGDGHLDILSANYTTQDLSVRLGHGDGTFGPKTDFSVSGNPIGIAVGDLNGDGKLDAVSGGLGSSVVSVLLNTSSTTLPSLSIADTSVKENPLGTRYVTFDVTLSAASDQTVTVHVHTAAGTATPGIDYVGRGATKTFQPGQTTQQFHVHILNDQPTGQNEQFFVNLDSPTNATIADGQAVCTIIESSGAPAPRGNRSGSGPSLSGSATSALATDQDTIVAGLVASLPAHSGQVATMQQVTANLVPDSVGRHGSPPILSAQTTEFRKGSHAALTDRHAVDVLFATDDGVTGF
jgi:hypothetical protein